MHFKVCIQYSIIEFDSCQFTDIFFCFPFFFTVKQIDRQLIAVAQFIFSVVAGFAFGFIGIELIVGDLDFGFRLLLGIICALVIALAEMYFLAKKLNEDEDDFDPSRFNAAKINVTQNVDGKKEHND